MTVQESCKQYLRELRNIKLTWSKLWRLIFYPNAPQIPDECNPDAYA